jgi:hypothetical protein
MHYGKLAEMRGRVVLQQEMMSVKTMKGWWEVERKATEADRDVMLRQVDSW